MDLNAHTGDNLNSSLVFMASDGGYFASQALRFGLPKPGCEAIRRREMLKERIREELLAEMSERRVLVDEVRQEILAEFDLERSMQVRRLPLERLSDFSATSGMQTICSSLGRGIGIGQDSTEFGLERSMEVRRLPLERRVLENEVRRDFSGNSGMQTICSSLGRGIRIGQDSAKFGLERSMEVRRLPTISPCRNPRPVAEIGLG